MSESPARLADQALVLPTWCQSLPRSQYKTLERVSVDDSWFEVYRIAPGVVAIYEPHQWEETVDYLVEGKTSALLIDSGMGIGDLKRLVNQLTRLPIIVVNSHTHADHTGNNWQFPKIYGFDSAYTRHNSLGSTEIRTEIEPGKICGALPKQFNQSTYVTHPWKISRWLHDGSIINLGGRTLRILATPGHAPDAICLFDQVNGLLFTGDTYYPGPLYIFGPGSDVEAFQRSIDRLAALAPKVRMVLGGHNEPIASPSMLSELSKEFRAVRTGNIKGGPGGNGLTEYKGPHVTFLLDQTERSR